MSLRKFCLTVLCILAFCAVSCVKTDYKLGYSLVAGEERYSTAVAQIPIDSLYFSPMDSMSAYSSSRMTIGAIRDDFFGLSRRTTAFALVPYVDSLSWGENVVVKRFRLAAKKDTLSYFDERQAKVIQNLHVYPLPFPIDSTKRYTNDLTKSMFAGKKEVVDAPVVYCGDDSLVIDFSAEFAMSYIQPGKTVYSGDINEWIKAHPGIFICSDDPMGQGGRLNFFAVASSLDNQNYLSGSFARLDFTADYKRKSGKVERVDTTFLFALGADKVAMKSVSYYAFNCSEHESSGKSYGESKFLDGKKLFVAKEKVYVEGGTGLKAMMRAADLRRLTVQALRNAGMEQIIGNIDSAFVTKNIVINRATLEMPYEYPSDYTRLKFYPSTLNPTLRVSKGDTVIYAGLTDASVSTENQGNIDYDKECYHPDLSHHLQQIMGTHPDTKGGRDSLRRENVWFLILANEKVTDTAAQEQADYYSQMAYLNYYNNMLGGYGYGSYGNGYDNYYSYYMMQQMYGSMSSSTTTTTSMLDKDRYYRCELSGPASSGRKPRLVLTFSYTNRKAESVSLD